MAHRYLDLRDTVVAWHPDGDLVLVGTTYIDDEGVGAVSKIAAPSSTR